MPRKISGAEEKNLSRSAPSGSATFHAVNNNGNSMRSVPVSLRASSPLIWPFTMLSSRTDASNDDSKSPETFNASKYSHDVVIKLNTNNLGEIPNSMGRLKSVKELRLTRNIYKKGDGLTDIPQSISSLTKLRILDLRGNPLKTVPLSVCQLENLTELNLENCQISIMPVQITGLKKLNRLSLDNNSIKNPELYYFSTVKYLSLTNNGILTVRATLPPQMITLDLSENFLTDLPEALFHKECLLEKLYLRENLLAQLPVSVVKLQKLKVLDVSKNDIRRLDESIGELRSLVFFNISYNSLTALPKSIINMTKIGNNQFLCGENPLQKPPIEVALKGLQSIKNYFNALDNSTEFNCKRLKLMVLGDANAGKTSLAQALSSGEDLEVQQNTATIGIDFYYWKEKLPDVDDTLEVMIVDCAGQRKYLLTHQLFLSIGMLFTIIVDLSLYKTTKFCFDEHIGYWMNLILAKVPNAVIMIVPTHLDLVTDQNQVIKCCEHMINCADDHIKEIHFGEGSTENLNRAVKQTHPVLPKSYQLELYDNVMESGRIDCDDPVIHLIPVSSKQRLPGLNLLRHEIIRIACDVTLSPNVHRCVPASWVNLEQICCRKRLSGPVVTLDELALEAKDFKDKKDLVEALQYIDSVGPILYFHAISNAYDMIFLDPNWLLRLLKLIFRHDLSYAFCYQHDYAAKYDMYEVEFKQAVEILDKTAMLSKKLLRCIWDDNISDNLFNEVIQLLQKCDLVYDVELLSFDQNDKSLLVPWFLQDYCAVPLVPDERKVCMVTLIETRGVLPDGFFQRLIIKIYSLNIFTCCTPWNYGFKGLNKDGEIVCTHQKSSNSSSITLQGFSSPTNIYHMWMTIIPILQVLENFIREWKGISHRLFSLCPECYSAKKESTGLWRLDLANLHQDDGMVSCQLERKEIDKWLIFPPRGILLSFIDKENKSDEMENYLNVELSRSDKDVISGLLGDRCEELRSVLNVHKGMLQPRHPGTNYRDRAFKIIELWEQNNTDISRKKMVTSLRSMFPYPHNAIDVLIK